MMSGVRTERSAAGFTLLEVLFVVFIVGLLTSLLAPRIGASLSSFEAVSQRRLIEDQLLQLPRRVRYIGRGLELPRDQEKKDIGDGAPAGAGRARGGGRARPLPRTGDRLILNGS